MIICWARQGYLPGALIGPGAAEVRAKFLESELAALGGRRSSVKRKGCVSLNSIKTAEGIMNSSQAISAPSKEKIRIEANTKTSEAPGP